jgi:hypothetical protein
MTKREAQINKVLAEARPLPLGNPSGDELSFAKLIQTSSGGIPCRGAWPDFGVYGADGRLQAVVEVKPTGGRWPLRSEQALLLRELARFGVPSFVWSPELLIRINPDGTAQEVEISVLTDLITSGLLPMNTTPLTP